jgi:beta-lactamase family protein
VRRWLGHLFHEWTIESWRPIAPAFAKPEPSKWSTTQVTLAWLGHFTVLINFFGVTILTDPVLFPRVGIRLPGITLGPKRLTAPALHFHDLPQIDVILLSHAHFDHFDLRTLRCFDETTRVITARSTIDLLKRTRFSNITELGWGESKTLSATTGEMVIAAFPVKHWGARTQHEHSSRVQWILNRTKGAPNYFCGRHRNDRKLRSLAATRSHRRRDHVYQRVQSVDPITLHARAGNPDGECRRRSLYSAGAPSNVPPQL